MKIYTISLGAGILVGIIYAFLHVRSPAPPAIALIGLLGILIGEQLVPIGSRLLSGEPITMAWFKGECVPKIMGTPPPEESAPTTTAGNSTEKS
jgi:XapX domain-containing protein